MIDFPQIPCFVTHLPNSKGPNPSLSETMFENYPGAHFGDFQYYKGQKCMFRDSRKLIGCCM